MKRTILLFSILLLGLKVNSQTTLDNFSDGDFTANPVWTVATGTASVSSGALVTNNSTSTGLIMSTPFTSGAVEWSLDLKSSSSSNFDLFRYYFILKDNADPRSASADGYFIEYNGNAGDYFLYVQINGATTSLGSFDGTANTSTNTIRITRSSANLFQVFINGTSRISVTDATYPSTSVEFQAIRVVENSDSDTYTVDNITYILGCFNPTSAGSIGNAQSNCGSFNPSAITSTAPATGNTGTLEYKWQQSTTSSTSGFSDIASSNASSFDPSTITQTTWYKRLARVSCASDWSGALESNVIEMTTSIVISGNPVSDTVYNQSGSASFGVTYTPPSGVTIQWQVSTNGGINWSNVSNGGYYSGVTSSTLQVLNPIYGMNNYQYRANLTSACGTVTSGSATLSVLPLTSFSNTTTASCGSWGTTATTSECLTRTIAVSGVGTLNTSSNVLQQINLSLGSSACKRNLSTYDFTLTSPSGTAYNFIANFSGTSTDVWANIKFRDDPALEKVNEYTTPANWFPYDIGYYAVDSDNSFASTFNGQNANGTWTFSMCEQSNAANNIAFNSIELVFGRKIQTNNISSSTANNDCSSAVCIGSDGVVTIGRNNGYSTGDPNYPGTSVGGCSYNGSNDNSAWFYFTAAASTAKITLSGIHNSFNNIETQPIIFSRSGGCNSGTFSVPTGGCPDDETYNNASYVGAQSAGNPYTNGISGNAEFNMSGLSAGQRYYLYVDGNASASSNFYIEVPFGCETCNTPLPIELIGFDVNLEDHISLITWQTASELNNDFFTLERSANGIDWEVIETIQGAGNSNTELSYQTFDRNPFRGISYYRLKQTDYDGRHSYSETRTISMTEGIMVLPNPGYGNYVVSGLSDRTENSIQLIDFTGKTIQKLTTSQVSESLDLSGVLGGVYYLIINDAVVIKLLHIGKK